MNTLPLQAAKMPTKCNTEIYQLLNKPLTAHSWSADKSKLAICCDSDEILILRKDQNKWIIESTLKEHDQLITGLDWCSATNKIVSCSMDRNAYVWSCDEHGKWMPSLAALRFSKGASCIAWNYNGTKFAAGSSDGTLAVGHYEAENDWWVCKHIKSGLENTISSLSWHPDQIHLAIGCIDGQVLIVSGYINEKSEQFSNFQVKTSSSILDVSFSPSGSKLVFTSNDASMTVHNFGNNQNYHLNVGDWPMGEVKYLSDQLIVCSGHNFNPVLVGFNINTKKWEIIDELISEEKSNLGPSSFGKAFAKFKSMDECALKEAANSSDSNHGHRNTVSKISILPDEKGNVKKISTSSHDGYLIMWDLENILINQKFSSLATQ